MRRVAADAIAGDSRGPGGSMSRYVWETMPAASTLRDCGKEGFAVLAAQWTESSYAARSPIVTAEETDDDVYFVLDGRVRAATYASSGREVQFSDLHAGEAFGLLAALDGLPRSTNVIALTDCRISRMSASAFNRTIESNTQVMRAFLRYLTDMVRSLSVKMSHVTTLSARQRLVAELLEMARTDPGGVDTAHVFPMPTQAELALLIFSQRETVARDLSRLKDEGLIDREGRTLRISSVERLRQIVEGT